MVVDCESDKIKATTIGRFFQDFKDQTKRAGSKQIWKLKDWPSTHEFQSAYPDLYNDFCDSLPVPDFTRREGVLNLYAHVSPGSLTFCLKFLFRWNGGVLTLGIVS